MFATSIYTIGNYSMPTSWVDCYIKYYNQTREIVISKTNDVNSRITGLEKEQKKCFKIIEFFKKELAERSITIPEYQEDNNFIQPIAEIEDLLKEVDPDFHRDPEIIEYLDKNPETFKGKLLIELQAEAKESFL